LIGLAFKSQRIDHAKALTRVAQNSEIGWFSTSRQTIEIVAVMTAEDCRRRAVESLHAAEAAADPRTSASLRRLSDAWATLAGHIEKDHHTLRERNAARKQSHQTEPREANTDTAQVADILRERLQLSDFDEPKS
jgi:hypothetical protein